MFLKAGFLILDIYSLLVSIGDKVESIQMEKAVSVSSDRNIRDHLWRWSTYFGWNIPTEFRRSIFDRPGIFAFIREFLGYSN